MGNFIDRKRLLEEMKLNRWSKGELCKKLNCTYPTLKKKLNIVDFTETEIMILFNMFGGSIFFFNNVSKSL